MPSFLQKRSKTHCFLDSSESYTVYPYPSFLLCEILFPNKLSVCKTLLQHCFGGIWAEAVTVHLLLKAYILRIHT